MAIYLPNGEPLLLQFLDACWHVLLELSPWLLLGMLVSGLLHVLLPADFIHRRFRGPLGVLNAVALGVPLPLCSCGVIPAGIGLRNEGADEGASIGFIISTPQTGIDSIFVSMSFLGLPFAIFKMVAALVMGVVGGLLTNLVSRPDSELPIHQPVRDCCMKDGSHGTTVRQGPVAGMLRHMYEVLHSFWKWMAIGILVSGAINVFLPETWMQQLGTLGTASTVLLVLLVSLPLYVCATASVPIAAALVSAGLPPSAALVFLMAGPASNTATIGAIYGRFGLRLLFVYLAVVIGGSVLSALVFDWVLDTTQVSARVSSPSHGNWLSIASAIVLLGLFGYCLWRDAIGAVFQGKPTGNGKKSSESDCCQIQK